MRMRIIVTAVLLVGLAGAIFWLVFSFTRPVETELGVTFSSVYAKSLGLDSRETYLALIDDLRVKKIRLPIYWSEIEPRRGQFNWDDLDFFMTTAEQHGIKLTLVIGRKVPRWPECFSPDWAEGLVGNEADEALLSMEETVVARYKNFSSIERWQVENEPFFPFGICPAPDLDLLNKETAQLRSLDQRPIVSAVSGEMDPWFSVPYYIDYDILGVSIYRVSYHPVTGLFPYPLTPFVYRFRSTIASWFWNREIIVSELQAEPWFSKPIAELTGEERAAAFTADDLRNNITFVKKAGFSEAYLWGAEWWYAEKKAGREALWTAAIDLFKK